MENENSFSRMFREAQIRWEERKIISDETRKRENRLSANPDCDLQQRVSQREHMIERAKNNRRKTEKTKCAEIVKYKREINDSLLELAKRRIINGDQVMKSILVSRKMITFQNVIILEDRPAS